MRNLNGIRSQELEVWQGIIINFYHNLLSLFFNTKNKFKSSE